MVEEESLFQRGLNGGKEIILCLTGPLDYPKQLLERCEDAINFHPGPPEYPGIGCTNFALYNGEKEYGVTCHHMLPNVDTGKIIAVHKFKIFKNDTVLDLTLRSYAHLSSLFFDIADKLLSGDPLPEYQGTWTRPPYKRSELDALCRITPDMDEKEIKRRIRAVTFPNAPGAYIELGGERFVLNSYG